MEYSNAYQGRHGFADFERKTFQITNKKDSTTIECQLLKVPDYTFTHTYVEKICEGNGWYSKGDKISEKITHDFYWLVILNGNCIGCINENEKKPLSLKYAIEDLKGKKHIKEYLLKI